MDKSNVVPIDQKQDFDRMMVPLNVTIQAVLSEGRMMSLVTQVFPGVDDEATLNGRIDRMVAIAERQRLKASIEGIEAEIVLFEQKMADYKLNFDYVESTRKREARDIEQRLAVLDEQYDRDVQVQRDQWNENDGRRPFDFKHPKVRSALAETAGPISKLREDLGNKRHEIDQGKIEYTANWAKFENELARLKTKLAETRGAVT